jgi:hypothetical protein
VLNAARTHRYLLTRRWADGPAAVFIMLNPSTADEQHDDPTIRRCTGFARREGCGALTVVNLFALRSADPHELARHPDPAGVHNDLFIALACVPAVLVIAAWGAFGGLGGRDKQVQAALAAAGVRLRCLGVTAAGAPRHPLYVRVGTPLTAWPAAHSGSSHG